MNRVLVLASVASMIDQFNMPNIMLLKKMGYEVDVACNFEEGNTCSDEKIRELKDSLKEIGVEFYQIDFSRKITNIRKNVRAFLQVNNILKKNSYVFIHCHSPIGGLVGRIAGKLNRTKVIYTAHGFHFCKGSPLKNWLIYYPVEWICSWMTDTLLVINREDYQIAKKKFHAKETIYIPGVGIDIDKINSVQINREEKRKELGLKTDDIVLLSVGELNQNKNHEIVIRALKELNNSHIKYVVCGQGLLKKYLEKLARELGVQNQLFLIGFRTDVIEIYKCADIFVFPSKREGLSVALMEAMACGLPCVVSSIRGNVDLIDKYGGTLFNVDSVQSCRNAIKKILKSDLKLLGNNNLKKVGRFSAVRVIAELKKVYQK